MSLTEFARFLGIHRATLTRLVSDGLPQPHAYLAIRQPLFRKADAEYVDPICRAVRRELAPRQPPEYSGCYR